MKAGERGAVELCEEAIYAIRLAPARALLVYYLGAVPFILGVLFFWTDMLESANARDSAVSASLGLAVLYAWMITCHAIYAVELRKVLARDTNWRPSLKHWLKTAVTQIAVQPTKLIVLPMSALMLLPLSVALAFYHNFSVLGEVSSARRQAALWTSQNWIFLGIVSMLSLVVFVNMAVSLILIPELLQSMLGIETVFTRSSFGILNTTFFGTAIALTYLALNPFVRAFYVVRCFYGESRTTAEDLRSSLTAALALLVVLAVPCAYGQPARASLDSSIDQVLTRPEYSWRTPRAPRSDPQKGNWLVRTTASILEATANAFQAAGRWLDELIEKLLRLMNPRLPGLGGADGKAPPAQNLRLLMVGLLAVIVGCAVYFVWRWLASLHRSDPTITPSGPNLVDLHSDDLQADQQPPDEWLELARACIDKGELRLALRALYLAGLASLAAASLISLARGKSDRDYARELNRKARNRPELLNAFSHTLGIFERTWYGLYDVDLALVHEVQGDLQQLRARAQ